MILDILYIVIGIVLLYYGGEWLVDSAKDLALKCKLSPLFIGLTIVSLGTSLPELGVTLFASFSENVENRDVAIGNIIGSNIANIGLVLGICACYKKVFIDKISLKRQLPFLLVVSVVFLILSLDNVLNFTDAIILFILLGYFLYRTYTLEKKTPQEEEQEEVTKKTFLLITLIVIGCILLVAGAKVLVTGASNIATSLGVPSMFIGLSIVACGTSLPELVASIIAVKHNQSQLCVGNIIGSNVFNILFVASTTISIHQLSVQEIYLMREFVYLILFVILFIILINKEKLYLYRWQGITFLVIYTIYLLHTANIINLNFIT